MKYLPLVWAALARRKVRSVLTLLSVVVAFVLFGIMHGVTAGMETAIDQMSDTRLRIQNRINITQALPLAHLPQIESVPGVEGVAFYNFLGTYYQDPSNQVAAGAMDMTRLEAMFGDIIEVSPEALAAMQRTRDGALVGADLMATHGWQVGDRIPLASTIWERQDGSRDWTFEIVGTYALADPDLGGSNELWVNYDYFDEERIIANGTVTLYFARIDDPGRAAAIAENIDALFANSANETQTQNEKDWIRAQIAQIGDIQFFVNAIIGAVLFTLLFLTGNTMMQSVRERVPELAVLKTYGYGNAAVTALVVAEAMALCIVAALVGLAIAAFAFPSVFRALGAGGVPLPTSVVVVGLGIALLVALLSALPPVWRAQRLSIVDALAGR